MAIVSKPKRTLVTDSVMSTTTTLGRWTGGKESVSGIIATVFGASGLLGPHVVSRLARIGSHVICPYRDDGWTVRELKCMGALGKVQLLPLDMTDEETIRRVVAKSNVVINLIGTDLVTRNYGIRDVNVHCTYRIAKAAAAASNVERFIQISAEGANLESESEFLSSKAEGENIVRHFFPNATIIRPNYIFGEMDNFINRWAWICNALPIMPTFMGGKQKFQPVWVNDVAQSVINSLYDYRAQGKTYHISGPEVFTQKKLNKFVMEGILQAGSVHYDISSKRLLRFIGWALELLPTSYAYRVISPELITRMQYDIVCPEGPDVLTHKDLGVELHTLQDKGRYIFDKHIGNRTISYQERHGMESRLNRNPALRHPNFDAQYPRSLYGDWHNDYDGIMPDGTKLPGGIFVWEDYKKKHLPDVEYEFEARFR